MNVLFVLTSSLFLLWVIRDIFFWTGLWEESSYRFDRFFVSLKKKKFKRRILLSPIFIPKWVLLFSFGYIVINDSYLPFYQYAIMALYIIQLFIIGEEVYKNKLLKPTLRMHSLLLIILTLVIVFLLFLVPLVDRYLWLLIIDLSVPLIVLFFVALLSFPSEIYSDWRLDKALKKLRRNPDMLVIAITGSTGKSLMTEYTAQILRQKFKVVMTHRANNTSDEIARTILSRLQSDTEIFVAEIKAYKRGEIRALCEVIKPTIGILTPINNQYVTLFHSIENIKKTNNELVESLPKKGYCLFNGNNVNTYGLYKASKKQKRLYVDSNALRAPKIDEGDSTIINAYNLVRTPKRVTFAVNVHGKTMKLQVPPNHSIEYLLPGISIAASLGMGEADIKRAIKNLK